MTNLEIIEVNFKNAVKGIKEEWLNTVNLNWYEYILGLPIKQRNTYLLIILENQVYNGGFHQYFVNGYGQFAQEAITALVEVGANKKSLLLQDAFDMVRTNDDTDFKLELLAKKINILFVKDDLFVPFDVLDNKYYECEEDINELLSNYLMR
jgi:hypothetical protein